MAKFETVALYLTTDNKNVPVSGNSHYIVVDKSPSRVTLFHPFTFSKFSLAETEFRMGLTTCEWNDHGRIADWLEKMATKWAGMHRQAPYKLIREIIADFRGVPMSSIADFHGLESE